MAGVSTCIWFDGGIEEAAALCVSLVPDGEIRHAAAEAMAG